jgi:hypothetical protein
MAEDNKSFGERLQQLEFDAQRIEVEKELALQKAIKSGDANEIVKAQNYFTQTIKKKEGEGKSLLIDPMNTYQHNGYVEKNFSLSFDMLRKMSRTPIPRAIIGTRKEQVAEFATPQRDKYSPGFIIRKKKSNYYGKDEDNEPTDEEVKELNRLTDFMLNCGNPHNKWHADDFETFLRKIVGDSLSLDQYTFEVIRNRKGEINEFQVTDASTFRIADTYDDDTIDDSNSSKQLEKINGYYPSYVQTYQARVVSEFYPWELCFGVRNPQTSLLSSAYGRSELEDLIDTVTNLLNADQYNSNYFKIGSNPKGLLRVKNLNSSRLDEFRSQWQAEMAGVRNCVAFDTEVSTLEYGNIQIGDLFDKMNVESEKFKVWTGNDWKDAEVFKSGVKRVHVTKLKDGQSIRTSNEHKFRVLDKEGNLIWKRQKNLTFEDDVVYYDEEFDIQTSKIVSLVQTMEEEEMYDLEVFDQFHQYVANGIVISNSHKLPIIDADKMEFISTQQSNKDMEYGKYYEFLVKISCAIFTISPEEIGFPLEGMNASKLGDTSNKTELEYSRSKGLFPLLRNIEKNINKYILSPATQDKYEFVFVGLNERTADAELEMAIKEVQYFKTVNEIRAMRGEEEIEGGDIILNPVFLQNKQGAAMGGEESNMFIDDMEEPMDKSEDPMVNSLQSFIDKELS